MKQIRDSVLIKLLGRRGLNYGIYGMEMLVLKKVL